MLVFKTEKLWMYICIISYEEKNTELCILQTLFTCIANHYIIVLFWETESLNALNILVYAATKEVYVYQNIIFGETITIITFSSFFALENSSLNYDFFLFGLETMHYIISISRFLSLKPLCNYYFFMFALETIM